MRNDTEAQAMAFLADAMLGGPNYAAERMERGEQRRAVASTNLPNPRGCKAEWEALGVVFGEKVDDLFIRATLPEGWSVEPSDHSMWNNIMDDKGRRRGQYFYKGAFYDRDAFLNHPDRRYMAERDYSDAVAEGSVRAVVKDAGAVIFATDMEPIGDRKSWDAGDEHRERALAWLIERFPDHENARAYWDESLTPMVGAEGERGGTAPLVANQAELGPEAAVGVEQQSAPARASIDARERKARLAEVLDPDHEGAFIDDPRWPKP